MEKAIKEHVITSPRQHHFT